MSAASATAEAQRQRIVVLASQREAAVAAVAQAKAARDLAQIDLNHRGGQLRTRERICLQSSPHGQRDREFHSRRSTRPVKIRFANNQLAGRLVPGLSARVEIDLGSGS